MGRPRRRESKVAARGAARFFNTSILWIRLNKLQEIVDKCGGFIPLPIILNNKTVNPKDGRRIQPTFHSLR